MRVRFWGTRGSIARPGPSTLRYGGNTSCVEVVSDSGTRVVLDCGTGAYGLGQELLAAGPSSGHLLISHSHWDHIQGFPFFTPLFVPGNEWDIYAPGDAGRGLENVLRGQMEYTYFPVTLDAMGATIRFNDLSEGIFSLGDIRVTTQYLNHPAVALGYRLEVGGVTVVYSTDHEPHSQHQATPKDAPREGAAPGIIHVEDQRHAEFLRNADLVIHDSQYTAVEYEKKVGWGHSTTEYVVDLAAAAGVKQIALFHHDPLRNDTALDGLVASSVARAEAWLSPVHVFAAAEGHELVFAESGTAAPGWAGGSATEINTRVGTARVLIVDDDPAIRRLISDALHDEGYALFSASDGKQAVALARTVYPDLILLDWEMAEMDGLTVCRTLRQESDPRLRDVPIILVTARTGSDDTQHGFEAGADDYLTKPFTPALLRTRVREWLARELQGRTHL